MHSRDTIIIVICLFLTVSLLIVSGLQLEPINKQRENMGLVIDKPEDIPPTLAFATIATGAFRGLVVDILWIRAEKLKEEGQFFDAKQLAEWITILQPRFASVWQFHAWNMAYNISVAIPATQPEQRWRWVKNGYELLRDEAITKYNLKNIGLYHELARIFQHKIGGISDDAQKYYKLQLATQMDTLLNSVDADLTRDDNKYYDLLAEAPEKWSDIVSDSNVSELVKALKDADENFSDEDDFVGNYLSLRQPGNTGMFNEAASIAIDNFRGTEALKKFDIFAKAYQLRKVWKLDPKLMRQVNRTYGPIDWNDPNTHLPMDWRHADSHAIYWAKKGLDIVCEDKDRDISSDETSTDRYITHSLQNLFRLGKMIIIPVPIEIAVDEYSNETKIVEAKQVFLRPDLRFFEPYNNAILKLMKKYEQEEDEGTLQTFYNQHRNMLKNAVLSFYQSGHREQAGKIYYNILKKRYPMPEFDVPLEEFARNRMFEELEGLGYQDATEQIIAMLKEGYYYYAIYDDEAAAARERDAKDIYNWYQKEYGNTPRIDLPSDFNWLKVLALKDLIYDRQYPQYLVPSLFGRLEIEEPELYKLLMAELETESQENQ